MVQALVHSSLANYAADAQNMTAVWLSMHPLSLLRCVFEIHNKACDYITSQYGVVVQRLRPFNPSKVASLDFHRDGTRWAYVVGLDHSTSGGTVFKNVLATQHPLVQQTGYMSVHNGQCLHGSSPVSAGERTVLVGFVKQAASEFYRDDDTGKDTLDDDVNGALITH